MILSGDFVDWEFIDFEEFPIGDTADSSLAR